MGVLQVLSFLGGIALFLYGMSIMGSGLVKLSGSKLQRILEKLTSNIYMGVLLGLAVTAVIQSSSATTVMVVGFVNSGIMKLTQAVGVIFGANIGTTVTAFILSLGDLSGTSLLLQLLKPASLAPLLCTFGLILFLTQKIGRKHDLGQILLGFGILFIGMNTMESAVHPLRDSEVFIKLMTAVSNPFLGVAVGAIFTAIIQSSSASVGILQALSTTGIVRFNSAAPVILGQNIGTCVTALISSVGANRDAKRAAMIHLYFNLIGTAIFIIILYGLKPIFQYPFWDSTLNRTSIAIFHLTFKVSSTLLLLPFNKLLVKLATLTIKDKAKTKDGEANLLDERFLQTPSLALDKSYEVVKQMGRIAISNFKLAQELIVSYDPKKAATLREQEDMLDKKEVLLDDYLVRLTNRSLTSSESASISDLLHITNDFERIGDYTMNILEMTEQMEENSISFSEQAMQEATQILSAVDEILQTTYNCFENSDAKVALNVEPLEQVIDIMQEYLKNSHIERLKSGICSVDSGMHFVDLITNLERIADHCSNIAVIVIQRANNTRKAFDFHSYIRALHEGNTQEYNTNFKAYHDKYMAGLLEH